ncbi:ATP-binding protein [Streptomyces sp. NBC_01485]|uniref:ATP-binding protein n=1 Tax=Streptomyces sp. NBC_01485 TaxID=2903884 RepID=UPI002E30CED9|nr:ATP-binding protein [Streptomyces sp. NBC_01485]
MIPSAPLGTDAAAGRPQGLGASAGAGPDQAAAERRFRFELAAHPGSPAQARRLTRARLTGWSVCADTCDSAALVITELVTNAIVHTASDVVVCELHDTDHLVRIAVRDEGCAPGEPHPSPQRPEAEHGRGLLLVEALCHAWGAHEHGPGLLVWADLPRKADAPRDPAEPRNSLGVDPAEQRHADLGELLDTLDEFPDAPGTTGAPRTGPAGPRNDLGWGARPKPGPSDGPGDEGEPAEQHHRPAEQRRRGVPDQAADGPARRVTPQRHRAPEHDARVARDARIPGHPAGAHPLPLPVPLPIALPLEHGRERGRI